MEGMAAEPRPIVLAMVLDANDREVIEACRRGDADAFRLLFESYKDRVYSIALYFFHGDAAVASDVTQQVFLKLMTTVHQFRGKAEFSTWLYRLVVNACTDAARIQGSNAVVFDRSRMEAVPAPDSQEEDYARRQMANSVRVAVSTLPVKFRIAILLRYFEDLSYEQMATALGCSMGTVASRLSRGHKILAERLRQLRPREES